MFSITWPAKFLPSTVDPVDATVEVDPLTLCRFEGPIEEVLPNVSKAVGPRVTWKGYCEFIGQEKVVWGRKKGKMSVGPDSQTLYRPSSRE